MHPQQQHQQMQQQQQQQQHSLELLRVPLLPLSDDGASEGVRSRDVIDAKFSTSYKTTSVLKHLLYRYTTDATDSKDEI
jgi:hypothetical protein